MISEWQIRRGFHEEVAPLRTLRCHDITALFDPDSGFLRQIAWADTPVLAGIYAAVRDQNWDTVAPRLREVEIEESSDDGFQIAFLAVCHERDIHFEWQGRIECQPSRLTYRFAGRALTSFRRNRVGFCVLHPVECAGHRCTIERTDGSIAETEFPNAISPHQPMMNLRSITHAVNSDVQVTTTMLGDTFEMEDQRNWTDASFKTYCTPLAEPFPVQLSAGDQIEQEIVLTFEPPAPESSNASHPPTATSSSKQGSNHTVMLYDSSTPCPLPQIGLGDSSLVSQSDSGSYSGRELALLRDMQLSHIRYDIDFANTSGAWRDVLSRAKGEADSLDVACELALFLTNDAEGELQQVLGEVRKTGITVTRWLIFHRQEKSTRQKWIALATDILGELEAPIGTGTDAYFTELNRERPETVQFDFASYSLNPQVHAFDDLSLVETIPVQGTTVASARTFILGKPIIVSPITLRPRYNPNATGPEPPAKRDELPTQVDPRQMSLFGAIWTLGSVVSLTRVHAHSLTYFETIGWRGVMESSNGSALPDLFPSQAGQVFPIYQVLRDIGEMGESDVCAMPMQASNPLEAVGISLVTTRRTRILFGNLTLSPQLVSIDVPSNCHGGTVRVLDETTYDLATRSPREFIDQASPIETTNRSCTIDLRPYAYAVLDFSTE